MNSNNTKQSFELKEFPKENKAKESVLLSSIKDNNVACNPNEHERNLQENSLNIERNAHLNYNYIHTNRHQVHDLDENNQLYNFQEDLDRLINVNENMMFVMFLFLLLLMCMFFIFLMLNFL